MRGNIYYHTVSIVVVLSLLFSPFSSLTPSALALSIEDEKKMGQEFVAQIKSRYELIDDDFASRFFDDLGHYLITPLTTQYFPFNFYVIKGNTVNAFAGPGGNIFMFSGLIETLDDIEQLVGVLCHEIAHVSARHLSKRVSQSKKIGIATLAGILAGIFIGGEAAGALMTGSMAAGTQAQLNYSRDDERQADQLAFRYMVSTGFDPKGMIHMLAALQKGTRGIDEIPTYLLTHPHPPERIALIQSLMSNSPAVEHREQASQFTILFPCFKTIVRAKCLDSTDAENLFNLELEKNPDAATPHLGLGIVYKERSQYDKAIHHLKKALGKKPGFIPILTNLGEVYQLDGQYMKAISTFEEALRLDEGNKSSLFFLGLSYEELEQYEKALRVFERLAAFKPVKDEVYYHLGICYGRLNRLAFAHYAFGLYFMRLHQVKKARFHFQKAEGLSENTPALKKKIREAMDKLASRKKP